MSQWNARDEAKEVSRREAVWQSWRATRNQPATRKPKKVNKVLRRKQKQENNLLKLTCYKILVRDYYKKRSDQTNKK